MRDGDSRLDGTVAESVEGGERCLGRWVLGVVSPGPGGGEVEVTYCDMFEEARRLGTYWDRFEEVRRHWTCLVSSMQSEGMVVSNIGVSEGREGKNGRLRERDELEKEGKAREMQRV